MLHKIICFRYPLFLHGQSTTPVVVNKPFYDAISYSYKLCMRESDEVVWKEAYFFQDEA